MERTLADPHLRSAIARGAREFAKENFSVERIRGQYCALYAEVLASRGKSAMA